MDTPQHLVCHVDGGSCEVIARFMPSLTDICSAARHAQSDGSFKHVPLPADEAATRLAQSIEQATHWLPCNRCRAVIVNAERLRGLRLGKRERDILLRASPAGTVRKDMALVCDASDTRAVRESKMRAARKLAKAGLVWTDYQWTKIQRRSRVAGKRVIDESTRYQRDGIVHYKTYIVRDDWTETVEVPAVVVGLTPLGAEIKSRYEAELQNGRAIRWDSRVTEAAQAARQDANALLPNMATLMKDRSDWSMQLHALGAAMGGNREKIRESMAKDEARMRAVTAINRTIGDKT